MADSFSDQRIADFSKRIGRDIKDDRVRITGNEIDISKLNETVGIHNKWLDNLTAAMQGRNFTFHTDADAAYSKLVPAGAMPYAGVKSVGGRTLVWNQLVVDNFLILSELVGITFTNNGDNSYTIKGTATESINRKISKNINIIANHKYLIKLKNNSLYDESTDTNFRIGISSSGTTLVIKNNDGSLIFSAVEDYPMLLAVRIQDGLTVNCTFVPQLFDLTLMFGAGNEPATVEEFEALFPADYYEYNAGELLSAGVSEVSVINRNLFNGKFSGTNTASSAYYLDIITNFDLNDYRGKKLTISFEASSSISIFSSTVGCGNGYFSSDLVTASTITDTGRRYLTVDLSNADILAKIDKYGSILAIRPVRYNTAQSFTATWSDLQIELGDTATPYTPYKETTAAIPPAVQNLPGYGWSAGTAKNWVDWENKRYIQEVGRAIYNGSSNVRYLDTTTTHTNYIIHISQLFSGGVLLRKGTWDCHFINNRFVHKKNGFNNVWQADWTNAASDALSISMPTSYETSEQVKEFFASNPLELYYELATPELIDISDILPADNLIEVEAGGTLTFKNQHGDDYRIPVPSEIEYMINVEEAL